MRIGESRERNIREEIQLERERVVGEREKREKIGAAHAAPDQGGATALWAQGGLAGPLLARKPAGGGLGRRQRSTEKGERETKKGRRENVGLLPPCPRLVQASRLDWSAAP